VNSGSANFLALKHCISLCPETEKKEKGKRKKKQKQKQKQKQKERRKERKKRKVKYRVRLPQNRQDHPGRPQHNCFRSRRLVRVRYPEKRAE